MRHACRKRHCWASQPVAPARRFVYECVVKPSLTRMFAFLRLSGISVYDFRFEPFLLISCSYVTTALLKQRHIPPGYPLDLVDGRPSRLLPKC